MYAVLLTVLQLLPSFSSIPEARYDLAIRTVEKVCSVEPESDREMCGRRLIVWSFFESALDPKAKGDGGLSCGIMQTNHYLAGKSCADLLDVETGYRAGLDIMRASIKRCGSVRSGLGMYSTGKCGGAPKKVAYRCTFIGC